MSQKARYYFVPIENSIFFARCLRGVDKGSGAIFEVVYREQVYACANYIHEIRAPVSYVLVCEDLVRERLLLDLERHVASLGGRLVFASIDYKRVKMVRECSRPGSGMRTCVDYGLFTANRLLRERAGRQKRLMEGEWVNP